jgi:hypothetical protein
MYISFSRKKEQKNEGGKMPKDKKDKQSFALTYLRIL